MSNRKLDRCDRCSTAIEVGPPVALTDMATMVELPHGDYSATFELSGENYMDVYCPECYETNRTLLEAAPDLLAALRQLMEWEGYDGGPPGNGHDEDTDRREQEVWQDAQDAIDKATGQKVTA